MDFTQYKYIESTLEQLLLMNYFQYSKKRTLIEEKIKAKYSDLENQNNGYGLSVDNIEFLSYLNRLLIGLKKFTRVELRRLLRDLEQNCEKRIKAVFICYEPAVWPSFSSLYKAMQQDKHFDTKIVHVPFDHEYSSGYLNEAESYYKLGLPILKYDSYDLRQDNPDVVFYTKAYPLNPADEKAFIFDPEIVCKDGYRCVFIPYAMETGNNPDSIRYQFGLPLHALAWMVTAYSENYYQRACLNSEAKGSNCLKIGHPRVDLALMPCENPEYVQKIKCLSNGRKIIMWNTHFAIKDGPYWGSFLQWGSAIIDYAKQNPNFFLLWRPHPFFKKAYEEVMGVEGTNQLFRQVDEMNNLHIDYTEDYLSAFHVSDALISDASSLAAEYLAWGKPILYTPKIDGNGFNDPNLQSCMITVDEEKDIRVFINNIINGIDVMKEKRESLLQRCLYLQNQGNVGISLKNFIYDQLDEEKSIDLLSSNGV